MEDEILLCMMFLEKVYGGDQKWTLSFHDVGSHWWDFYLDFLGVKFFFSHGKLFNFYLYLLLFLVPKISLFFVIRLAISAKKLLKLFIVFLLIIFFSWSKTLGWRIVAFSFISMAKLVGWSRNFYFFLFFSFVWLCYLANVHWILFL